MKTIGLIGGMSAESTAIYYALLNKGVRNRLGGLHSADILMRSVDFASVASMQTEGRWSEAGAMLAQIARQLETGGAELVILATNTMHKVIDDIAAAVGIPVIHIADPTAAAIQAAGLKRPGLLATKFTMEQDFYSGRLREKFKLEPVIPSGVDRAIVHGIIYDELCQGSVKETSRQTYINITERLVRNGADCLILGCTEVGLLLNQSNVAVPVFDTVELHVAAALDQALP